MFEEKKYYSYSVYKDTNPNSRTFGQYKFVRNLEKDDECTEKFAPKWVLKQTECSLIPVGIIKPENPEGIKLFKVEEWYDENPNSLTYNTYMYRQIGYCDFIEPEPKWQIVPEKTGPSSEDDNYNPNLPDGELRYCIETYIDTNPSSPTYNQYKYVLCDTDYNETEYRVVKMNVNSSYTCDNCTLTFTGKVKKIYNNAEKPLDAPRGLTITKKLEENNVSFAESPSFPSQTDTDGKFEFTINFKNNETAETLSDVLVVTINNQEFKFEINQTSCTTFTADPTTQNHSAAGETISSTITSTVANEFREWTITNTDIPSWLTVENKRTKLEITTKENA